MDNLNYLFYEEFTKMERTCTLVYQVELGVQEYIERMLTVSSAYAEQVPCWQEDLQQLHRYSMVYTALAQSAEAMREYSCRQEDVDWIRKFGSRIIERKDPLALLQEQGYRAEDDAWQRLEDDRNGEIVIIVRDTE